MCNVYNLNSICVFTKVQNSQTGSNHVGHIISHLYTEHAAYFQQGCLKILFKNI